MKDKYDWLRYIGLMVRMIDRRIKQLLIDLFNPNSLRVKPKESTISTTSDLINQDELL
jgi:sugar lactone lactonase YvrE